MTNTNKHHPRRQAREAVFQALYAYDVAGESKEKVLKDILERYGLDGKISNFISTLFLTAVDHREWVVEIITTHLENWDFDRVALLDRLILQMAICELYFIEDVPPKVSIAEAIEIAKQYSTEESSSFVNGILDAIYKEIVRDHSQT